MKKSKLYIVTITDNIGVLHYTIPILSYENLTDSIFLEKSYLKFFIGIPEQYLNTKYLIKIAKEPINVVAFGINGTEELEKLISLKNKIS